MSFNSLRRTPTDGLLSMPLDYPPNAPSYPRPVQRVPVRAELEHTEIAAPSTPSPQGSIGSPESGLQHSGSFRRQQRGTSVTPPHPTQQRPLPVVPPGGTSRGSPTYPHATSYPTQRGYEDRDRGGQPVAAPAPATKARTPDRSLPVQEENEAEEEVTMMMQSLERERERMRERERERERDRERERENQVAKDRRGLRLPTPQFSSSPMIPPMPDQATATDELSSTVQGDDYESDGEHDGRSSRVGHYEDEAEKQHHIVEAEPEGHGETTTPRSPHPALPMPPSQPSANFYYNMYSHHPHLHFRPRTASSDVGGMVNLDAALSGVEVERLQSPAYMNHINSFFPTGPGYDPPGVNTTPDATSQDHGRHENYPSGSYTSRVPNAEDLLALASDAQARHTQAQTQAQAPTSRPNAPVPPTPPTLPPNHAIHPGMILPSGPPYLPSAFSPPPTRATPYPFNYAHQYQYLASLQRSPDPSVAQLHYMQRSPVPQAHPQDILHHHLQMLALQTDSTFSPSSTPFPSYDYSPFLPEHFRRRAAGPDSTMSMRSSPSHLPLNLPYFPGPGRSGGSSGKNRNRKGKGKGEGEGGKPLMRRVKGSRELVSDKGLSPRGASTEPRDTTSPESSDGEEAGEGGGEDAYEEEMTRLAAKLEGSEGEVSTERERVRGVSAGTTRSGGIGEKKKYTGAGNDALSEDEVDSDEGDWVDSDEDADDSDDLLHLEYHPSFVVNPDKRRKRWDTKWEALVKAFHALDKQTHTTLLLLAAPPDRRPLRLLRSRSLRRPPFSSASPISQIKSSFHTLTQTIHTSRLQSRPLSLTERFQHYLSSSPTSSGSSAEPQQGGISNGNGNGIVSSQHELREEELKSALGAALGSLAALGRIYETREERWRGEMAMIGEERERVEVLLGQALGVGNPMGMGARMGMGTGGGG